MKGRGEVGVLDWVTVVVVVLDWDDIVDFDLDDWCGCRSFYQQRHSHRDGDRMT